MDQERRGRDRMSYLNTRRSRGRLLSILVVLMWFCTAELLVVVKVLRSWPKRMPALEKPRGVMEFLCGDRSPNSKDH